MAGGIGDAARRLCLKISAAHPGLALYRVQVVFGSGEIKFRAINPAYWTWRHHSLRSTGGSRQRLRDDARHRSRRAQAFNSGVIFASP
jgi:hypothetical protein